MPEQSVNGVLYTFYFGMIADRGGIACCTDREARSMRPVWFNVATSSQTFIEEKWCLLMAKSDWVLVAIDIRMHTRFKLLYYSSNVQMPSEIP